MDVDKSNDKKCKEELLEKYLFSIEDFYQNSEMVPGILKAIVENDLNKLMNMVESGLSTNVLDCYENGPLHVAVIKNNASILDYLLSRDAKCIDQQNFSGETALFRAIIEEKYELVEKLILAGANVNIPDNGFHISPLHAAISSPRTAHLLIKHGAEINYTDRSGRTPLLFAVEVGCLETVCMLLYYNADCSIANKENCTPFMMALTESDIEIQKVLFEYVDDYEVKTIYNYSVLGLAIIYNSPFTEEMIMRGADVNNVNTFYVNAAFFFTLRYSRLRSNADLNTLKLIWERMDYQHIGEISVLGVLLFLEIEQFHNVIDIFINSNKMRIIAQSVSQANDFSPFSEICINWGLPLEKYSALFYRLLSYGYAPNETEMTIIFYNWGYCELFRILLHMDIRYYRSYSNMSYIFTRIMCDVHYTTNELLNNLVIAVREKHCRLDDIIVIYILDYFIYPPLLEIYSKVKTTNCLTLKVKALQKVPSLVELARNQTREHLKKMYKVTNSSQLITIINNLDITDICKKILTFERAIYRPTFTKEEFKIYLNMLNMVGLRRQVKVQLIQSAIRYSIIVDDGNRD